MKIDKKKSLHYLKVSLVLGGIVSISALLISISYMICQPVIEENEYKRLVQSLANIYGEDKTYEEIGSIDDSSYSYLNAYYSARKDDEIIGYIFSSEGSNQYGSISMLTGINPNGEVDKIYLLTNDQTYPDKIQNDYVDPFNKGEISLDDIYIGATFGAELIKNMANQASQYYMENVLKQ